MENTDSEQQNTQSEPVYTVIHPEVTEDVPKKFKEPKKTNKSKQTAEPTQVVEPIESISNIPQDDFIPLDYEINSEDLCRDIEMIIDELEEDLISEITDLVSLK